MLLMAIEAAYPGMRLIELNRSGNDGALFAIE
jgi:hypothetical protein